jgi:urate oxidase
VSDYTEINELRNINNSIKHSRSIINEKTKNILEFKNKKQIQYSDLLSFYKRIENSTVNFISSLSNFIQKDLYEFDDERIEKIAQRILLRMEKNDVDKSVSKLK